MLVTLALLSTAKATEAPPAETPNAVGVQAPPATLGRYRSGMRLGRHGAIVGSSGAVLFGAGTLIALNAGDFGVGLTGFSMAILGGGGLFVGSGMMQAGASMASTAMHERGADITPGNSTGWVLFGASFLPLAPITLPLSYVVGGTKPGAARRAHDGAATAMRVHVTPILGRGAQGLQLSARF